jgi:hypothetical protein
MRGRQVEIILAALLAGLVTGTQNTVATAVQDAYTGLRDALKRLFAGRLAAQEAVDEYVKDPDAWKAKLETHLKDVGADQDQDVLAAAKLVMQYASQNKQATGKYIVNNAGSTGNQFGDGNTQTFTFGSSAR